MEENPDGVTEGLNEWEQIQAPSHHPSSSTTTAHSIEHDDGPTVAIIDDYIPNNYSVFHPSNHEGLPIVSPPQDNPHAQETPSFSSDSISDEGDEVGPIGSRLRVLRSWVVRVGYGVRSCGGCRGGFWSFVCATGVLALAVVYVKVMRWRRRVFRRESEERLMLLLREKDKVWFCYVYLCVYGVVLHLFVKMPVLDYHFASLTLAELFSPLK